MHRLLWLLTAAALVPTSAAAETYRYETTEGTVSFTDDLKRVPSRYRDAVEALPERSLWSYPRLTPMPRAATAESSPSRPETVRVNPAPAPTEVPATRLNLEVIPGISIEVDSRLEEPIRVRREYRWVDGALRPHTVVRQGDRVLAVRIDG